MDINDVKKKAAYDGGMLIAFLPKNAKVVAEGYQVEEVVTAAEKSAKGEHYVLHRFPNKNKYKKKSD